MNNTKGQAFVEAVIVLPFAFLLLFLLFEFSFVFITKNLLELATFRAARSYISLNKRDISEKALVQTMKSVAFSKIAEKSHYIEFEDKPGSIKVSAVYFYKPLFPIYRLLKIVAAEPLNITAKSSLAIRAVESFGAAYNGRVIFISAERHLNR
jgi:hypothetical protein